MTRQVRDMCFYQFKSSNYEREKVFDEKKGGARKIIETFENKQPKFLCFVIVAPDSESVSDIEKVHA